MPVQISHRLTAFALAALLATFGTPLAGPWQGPVMGTNQAMADDDDDGDDDDDAGGSGGAGSDRSPAARGGGSGGRPLDIFRQRQANPRRTAPKREPATHAPREIVALGLDDAALATLLAEGYAVRERVAVALDGGSALVKLGIPRGVTLAAARSRAVELAPSAEVDFNHYYRPDQAGNERCGANVCLARQVVGWPAADTFAGRCTTPARIGLIDTAVNADHLAFAGGRIETIRLGQGDLPASGRQHGTAVAALLIGSAESRTPGLVPGGELIAVDAFHRGDGSDDRSEVYDLVRAIDLLAARGVQVINMSLTGPANPLLEKTVGKATETDIVLVAAAGNDGPRAAPLYPAAYDGVIAVTAIDRAKNPYRRAGSGDHIDIAAPGVQVWTAASVKGAQPKTGTSFAAPFVTAAAAILKASNPALGTGEVEALLRQSAEDLGAPGKDPVYGWGLLNGRAICQG